MAKTPADRIASAQAAFEAGFASKAAQKRALDELNRAYETIQDAAYVAQIAAAPYQHSAVILTEEQRAERGAFFRANDLPFDLHHVRDRHLQIIDRWLHSGLENVKALIALRAAIKDAEIAPAPAKPEIEVKAEAVRKTIAEEMEARKVQFVEGLGIARLFNGLPVSVNVHWVHGHKGAVFLRHFFYLRGKLTPLNMILAIAEAHAAEKKAAR